LNHREFIHTLDAEHTDVPYHFDILWSNLAKVLKKVMDLQDDVPTILDKKIKI
jgi:hypothetical protein